MTVVTSAQSFVNEFNSAQPLKASLTNSAIQLSWEAPPENFLKVNIDAGHGPDGSR